MCIYVYICVCMCICRLRSLIEGATCVMPIRSRWKPAPWFLWRSRSRNRNGNEGGVREALRGSRDHPYIPMSTCIRDHSREPGSRDKAREPGNGDKAREHRHGDTCPGLAWVPSTSDPGQAAPAAPDDPGRMAAERSRWEGAHAKYAWFNFKAVLAWLELRPKHRWRDSGNNTITTTSQRHRQPESVNTIIALVYTSYADKYKYIHTHSLIHKVSLCNNACACFCQEVINYMWL
jgi:hypothetical protein